MSDYEEKYVDLIYGAIEYVRKVAKENEQYQEGETLSDLADELEHVSDEIQDVMVDLDESEEG